MRTTAASFLSSPAGIMSARRSLIQAALKEAGLGKDEIDGIATTAGPGLVGAILVGRP